jgi:hypothetical protein
VKLLVPVATRVISRPRLHALLAAGLHHPVTVIAAAAGWGKTLLAASWVAAGSGGRAAAWVSLDEGDDNPDVFWRLLATALLPIAGPECGTQLRAMTAQPADAEDLPGALAAAVRSAARPLLLVLDSLHEVSSPAVHAGLLRLIERPLPMLSLLVTTRRDPPWPLTQLRLAGLVAEVRVDDLAFHDEEAAALFAQLHVDLTDSQVARLVERTEGWPAGLRLVALHLQGRTDIDAAVDAFSGDDHSVAGYLLTEILDQQAPELIAFLQSTTRWRRDFAHPGRVPRLRRLRSQPAAVHPRRAEPGPVARRDRRGASHPGLGRPALRLCRRAADRPPRARGALDRRTHRPSRRAPPPHPTRRPGPGPMPARPSLLPDRGRGGSRRLAWQAGPGPVAAATRDADQLTRPAGPAATACTAPPRPPSA